MVHWKEGHKNDCCAPKAINFDSAINKSENMCNGDHLKTSKSVDSTIELNPISLGFFKCYNKKIIEEKKQLLSHSVNAPSNALTTTKSLSRPKTVLLIFY